MLSLLIIGVALLGLIGATTGGHQHQWHSEHALRAVRLAEHLVEEIQGRPYTGNGTDRVSFHMSDYDNFHEPAGLVRDFMNVSYGSADQVFSRSATVTDSTMTVNALESAQIAGKTVVVAVQDGAGMQWTLTRFIPEPIAP